VCVAPAAARAVFLACRSAARTTLLVLRQVLLPVLLLVLSPLH
jgi:hypothetical protein